MELISERMDPAIMTLVTTIDGTTTVGFLIAQGTEPLLLLLPPLGDHHRRTEVTIMGAGALEVEVHRAKVGARRLVKIGGETTLGTRIAPCGIRMGEIDTVVTSDRAKVHLVIAIDGGTTMIEEEATVNRSYGACNSG